MLRQKILLVNPPYSYQDSRVRTVSVPMGLLYVAAAVEREHDVRIVDMNFDCDIHNEIRRFTPDFIGISALSPQFPTVIQLAKDIKERHKNPRILVGGVHATIDGATLLKKFPAVDYIIRGEGEVSLPKLLNGKKKSKIKGLVFRESGSVIDNGCEVVEDLDTLAYPARHLIDLHRYQDFPFYYRNHLHTPLLTSRGCPYKCNFCYDTPQKKYREHSIGRVIEEIKRTGLTDFRIIDDVFTLNTRRTEEICRRILDENLQITWSCQTRPDCINEQLLKLMKEAGCHTIYYGIESGNQEVLNKVNKGFTLNTVRQGVRCAKEAGIRVQGGFILGFPFEDEVQLDETVEFSKSVGLDGAEFTIATPYPGTGLWKLAGYEDPSDLELLKTLNFSSVSGNHFWDEQKIAGKYSQAIMGFYFRKREFLNTLRGVFTEGTLQRRWELFKYLTFKGPTEKGGTSHDEVSTTPTLIEKFFNEQCELCHGCDHTCKRRWFCYCQKIVNRGIYAAYCKGLKLIEWGEFLKKRNKKKDLDIPRHGE